MLKQNLKNTQDQVIKSTGIIEKAVRLENGSTILFVKDTINEITFKHVLNFRKTALKQNDYVDIEYSIVKGTRNGRTSNSLEINLNPIKFEDTLICASSK